MKVGVEVEPGSDPDAVHVCCQSENERTSVGQTGEYLCASFRDAAFLKNAGAHDTTKRACAKIITILEIRKEKKNA